MLTKSTEKVLYGVQQFLAALGQTKMNSIVDLAVAFLADRTIGRAFGTVSRLSVVCPSSVRL